jgi:hypothetical protein
MSEILDKAVAYHYEGVPSLTAADVINACQDIIDATAYWYYRRPRLASFDFGPLLRTPVHDLPHDGVGVLALHRDEWRHLAREFQSDLPAEMNVVTLFGVALEEW